MGWVVSSVRGRGWGRVPARACRLHVCCVSRRVGVRVLPFTCMQSSTHIAAFLPVAPFSTPPFLDALAPLKTHQGAQGAAQAA